MPPSAPPTFPTDFRFPQKNKKNIKTPLTNRMRGAIMVKPSERRAIGEHGSIAQLGEHLPYKQRVIGSSPIVPTIVRKALATPCEYGLVAQLVRALPCHGRGRGFEPHPGRQFASVAQLVEQRTENPRVVGSIPTGGTSDLGRYADLAHLVERHLAKVEVAGSSPVIRSKQKPPSSEGSFHFYPKGESV